MKIAVCLVLLSCLLTGVQCNPTGAPTAACDTVSPNPAAYAHNATRQNTTVPYSLTGLPTGNYTPGATYMLTLSGTNSEMFRGFLVVTTSSSGRVGSFTPGGADSKEACDDMGGITHTGAEDKMNVNFNWTAPDEGTGTVEVRFAVVRERVTYWANQVAATLYEAQPQPEPSTSTDMMSTPSAASDMASPSASSDMANPSTSSMTGAGATSSASQSPSPTTTPAGGGGNSTPSNVPGSLATMLLAAAAFVMLAVFA